MACISTTGEGVEVNNIISQPKSMLTTYVSTARFDGNLRMSATFYAVGSSVLKEKMGVYAFLSFYNSITTKFTGYNNLFYVETNAYAENTRLRESSFINVYEEILATDYLNAFEYDANDENIYLLIQTDKAFVSGELDGEGTFANPYKVTSYYALSLVAKYQSESREEQKAFIQTRDITLFNYVDNNKPYNYNKATTIYIDNFYDVYYGQSYRINLADSTLDKDKTILNVFGVVESCSIIKDVNIYSKNETYTTNVSSTDKTKELTGTEYASVFIGQLKGSIINITVNSGTFNLGTGSLTQNDYLGVIVGRAEVGSVIRNANISATTTINFDINGYLTDYGVTTNREAADGIATYMGGIVGYSAGTIINSYVGSTIVMDTGYATDTSFNHTLVYMGGIVGKATYSIDSCLFNGQMVVTGSNALTTANFGTTGNRKFFAGIAGDFECGPNYKGFNNVISSVKSLTNTTTSLDLNNTSIFNLLKISAISAMTSYNASQVYYNVASHYDFYKSLSASGITSTSWSANNSANAESRIGTDAGCLYASEQAFYNNLLLTDKKNYYVYTQDAIHLNIEFFNNRSIDEGNYQEVTPSGKTYYIYSAKQLNYISYISQFYDLSDDYFYGYSIHISNTIDMAGYRWIPLKNFKGSISGSIVNLYIEQAADSICEYSGKYGIGFIGLSSNGNVGELSLKHACINAYSDPIFKDVENYTWCVGGAVGISIITGTYTHRIGTSSRIDNCSINTTVNYIYNTNKQIVINTGLIAGYVLAVENIETGYVVVTNYSGFNIMYERDDNPNKLVTINAGIMGTVLQSRISFYECSVGYNQISGKMPMYLDVETTSNYDFKLNFGSYVGLAANSGVSISKSIMAGMNILCGLLNTEDWSVGSLVGYSNNVSATFNFSQVVIMDASDSVASGSYNYAYQYLGYYTEQSARNVSASAVFAFYNGNLSYVYAGGYEKQFAGEYDENSKPLSSMISTMANSYNFLYEWQIGFGNFKTVYGDKDGLIGLYRFNPDAILFTITTYSAFAKIKIVRNEEYAPNQLYVTTSGSYFYIVRGEQVGFYNGDSEAANNMQYSVDSPAFSIVVGDSNPIFTDKLATSSHSHSSTYTIKAEMKQAYYTMVVPNNDTCSISSYSGIISVNNFTDVNGRKYSAIVTTYQAPVTIVFKTICGHYYNNNAVNTSTVKSYLHCYVGTALDGVFNSAGLMASDSYENNTNLYKTVTFTCDKTTMTKNYTSGAVAALSIYESSIDLYRHKMSTVRDVDNNQYTGVDTYVKYNGTGYSAIYMNNDCDVKEVTLSIAENN
ncbi:MAG: hypothetical protein J6V40_02430, partial [Clostridia bacterium]|nr:hypothetical protein [Clostridia bacterium]